MSRGMGVVERLTKSGRYILNLLSLPCHAVHAGSRILGSYPSAADFLGAEQVLCDIGELDKEVPVVEVGDGFGEHLTECQQRVVAVDLSLGTVHYALFDKGQDALVGIVLGHGIHGTGRGNAPIDGKVAREEIVVPAKLEVFLEGTRDDHAQLVGQTVKQIGILLLGRRGVQERDRDQTAQERGVVFGQLERVVGHQNEVGTAEELGIRRVLPVRGDQIVTGQLFQNRNSLGGERCRGHVSRNADPTALDVAGGEFIP